MQNESLNKKAQSNAVEEIKSRLDIVDTVSEQVVLKKSGRNYWGICPFHKEKTPSFSVNPDKGIFKCFGCGAGGDSLSFLMKINNSSFWETIVMLAQKFGIPLPEAGVSSEKLEIKNKIIEANKETAKFYTKCLVEGLDATKARDYLLKRGINRDVIEKFSIGFAPNSYDALQKHLQAKGYDNKFLHRAGLVSEKMKGTGYIDRLGNRIMVPIQNEKGDYIAFGARAIDENQTPKYLNSSDTEVFNKSRSLYAINFAKDAIRQEDSVILMEGFFDVITAQANGINNAVATLGTALTEQHIKIIARYSDSRKIFLAFDTDEAGVNATKRGAEIIKSTFSGLGDIKHFDENFAQSSNENERSICEIRIITTNSGKDPDEFIRTEGAENYRKVMENAPLLIDYQINKLITTEDRVISPQEKANITKEIIPILAEIKNSIIRDEYVRLVAGKLGISEEALDAEIKKSLQNVNIKEKNNTVKVQGLKQDEKDVLAQKNLLGLYFLNNEKITPLCINNYLREVNFSAPELKKIKKLIDESIEEYSDPDQLFNFLMTKLVDDEEAKKSLTDLLYTNEDKQDLDDDQIKQYIIDHINYLEMFRMNEIYNSLRNEYYQANKDEMSSIEQQKRVIEFLKNKKCNSTIQ